MNNNALEKNLIQMGDREGWIISVLMLLKKSQAIETGISDAPLNDVMKVVFNRISCYHKRCYKTLGNSERNIQFVYWNSIKMMIFFVTKFWFLANHKILFCHEIVSNLVSLIFKCTSSRYLDLQPERQITLVERKKNNVDKENSLQETRKKEMRKM